MFSLFSVLGPRARSRLRPPGRYVALPDLSCPLVAEILDQRLKHEHAPRIQLQRPQRAVPRGGLCGKGKVGEVLLEGHRQWRGQGRVEGGMAQVECHHAAIPGWSTS